MEHLTTAYPRHGQVNHVLASKLDEVYAEFAYPPLRYGESYAQSKSTKPRMTNRFRWNHKRS